MKTTSETIKFINEGISNLGLSKKIQKKHEDKDILEDFDEFVDLGLPSGIRWAKYNVGATSEEEYGNYFSYEEIGKFSKGNIRVPDNTDWTELKRYCTFGYVSLGGGTKGMIIQSKIDPNKYIFLPPAGYDNYGTEYDGREGYYMLRNIYGYVFYFNGTINYSSFMNKTELFKDSKYSIRLIEVPPKKKKKLQELKSNNLGLSSKITKKYADKKHEDIFGYVTDVKTLEEFFRDNGATVTEFPASSWSEHLNRNYVYFRVCFPGKQKVDIKYSKEFEWFFIADSEIDYNLSKLTRENPEFGNGNYFIKDDRISFGKFKLSKEHPIPKFVLDIILEEIQNKKE